MKQSCFKYIWLNSKKWLLNAFFSCLFILRTVSTNLILNFNKILGLMINTLENKHTILKMYSYVKLELKSQILICFYFSEFKILFQASSFCVTPPPAGGGRDPPSSEWGAILPFLLPRKVLICAFLLSFCPICPICHLRTDAHLHPGAVWSPRLCGPLGATVTWANASPAVWLRPRRLGRPCCCVGVDVSLILGSRSDKEAGGPHFSLEVPGHAVARLILCDNNDSIFHNPPLLARFDLTSPHFLWRISRSRMAWSRLE